MSAFGENFSASGSIGRTCATATGSCPRTQDGLFWAAVRLKASYPIAYADAFAAALAIERQATLLTADPEFSALGERLSRVAVQADL